MPRTRLTIRRLMLEIAFGVALVWPIGCVIRASGSPMAVTIGWGIAAAWIVMILMTRRAYRDFRNPFG